MPFVLFFEQNYYTRWRPTDTVYRKPKVDSVRQSKILIFCLHIENAFLIFERAARTSDANKSCVGLGGLR